MSKKYIIYSNELDDDGNPSFYDLDEERENLNVNVGDPIIEIAYLDLWDGRHTAFRTINSGNLRDCLAHTVGDYVTWYVDDQGDLWCRDAHHDGTNLYLYRAWKADVSTTRRLNLLDKVAWNKVTRRDITNCTRPIGTYAADVYGWIVRRR